MNDPIVEFQSPKRKLKRAKQHIDCLTNAISGYLENVKGEHIVSPLTQNDGTMWARRGDRGDAYLHKIHLTFPVEHDLDVIASDALQNLRQALDHAASACARSLGKTDKGTWFPLVGAGDDLEEAIKDKCRKLPDTIKDIIRKSEPGGGLLCQLHDLGIQDKHRLLCEVGSFGRANLRYMQASPTGWIASGFDADEWDPLNHDIRFALTGSPDELNYAFEFGVAIRFNATGDLAAQPALTVLNTLANTVDNIIGEMLTEMIRLLP